MGHINSPDLSVQQTQACISSYLHLQTLFAQNRYYKKCSSATEKTVADPFPEDIVPHLLTQYRLMFPTLVIKVGKHEILVTSLYLKARVWQSEASNRCLQTAAK